MARQVQSLRQEEADKEPHNRGARGRRARRLRRLSPAEPASSGTKAAGPGTGLFRRDPVVRAGEGRPWEVGLGAPRVGFALCDGQRDGLGG